MRDAIMSKTALVSGAALLAALPWASAGADFSSLADEVDGVFAAYDRTRPGCAVGVIHEGAYQIKKGYGLANLEHEIPIESHSIFRIGSVSKQFTAMAVALLAERGAVDLDADVHEYLPDLIDYGYTVTVRQMIHHTAGMGDYDPALFVKGDGTAFRFGNEDYWTIEEFYEAVRSAPLVVAPDSKWMYSNVGYFLLGQVVERVSGKTLRQFAADEIFAPLGMSSTFFNDNVNRPVKHRVDGYRKMDGGGYEIYMTNLDWVGDGGVFTNLDDFIRWDRNFYDNRLGEETIAITTEPLPGFVVEDGEIFGDARYAFGHFVGESHGQAVIGHSGGWVGFSSLYLRYPALSVVTFCNATDAPASELGSRVAALAVAAATAD